LLATSFQRSAEKIAESIAERIAERIADTNVWISIDKKVGGP